MYMIWVGLEPTSPRNALFLNAFCTEHLCWERQRRWISVFQSVERFRCEPSKGHVQRTQTRALPIWAIRSYDIICTAYCTSQTHTTYNTVHITPQTLMTYITLTPNINISPFSLSPSPEAKAKQTDITFFCPAQSQCISSALQLHDRHTKRWYRYIHSMAVHLCCPSVVCCVRIKCHIPCHLPLPSTVHTLTHSTHAQLSVLNRCDPIPSHHTNKVQQAVMSHDAELTCQSFWVWALSNERSMEHGAWAMAACCCQCQCQMSDVRCDTDTGKGIKCSVLLLCHITRWSMAWCVVHVLPECENERMRE